MLLADMLLAGLAAALVARVGWSDPATIFVFYILGVMAFADVAFIGLAPASLEARLTIVLGVTGFTLPALILGRRRQQQTSEGGLRSIAASTDGTVGAAHQARRMVLWAVALTVLTLVGFSQSPHAGIGGLTFLDVRKATTAGALSLQDYGFAPLLSALAPLVAAIGVLGVVRFREARWLLLVAIALATTLPTPGKTYTLGVVLTSIVFYLLCRRRIVRGPRRRGRVAAIIAVSIGVSLVYFVGLDTALNKDTTLSQQLRPSWVPSALLGPVIYEVGGLSALSVAQSSGADPRVDHYGRSIYLVPWALRFVDNSFQKPQTIAYNVFIPIPFNVYTGFGDLWFDFGWIGVFLVSAFFGGLVALAYRRWRPAALQWGILLALLSSLMASMTISIRLFYLDSVLQLLVGYFVFRHIAAAGDPLVTSELAFRTGGVQLRRRLPATTPES